MVVETAERPSTRIDHLVLMMTDHDCSIFSVRGNTSNTEKCENQIKMKVGDIVNKRLLKSFMVAFGDTNKELAEYLGISEASVSAKINENKTEFKQSEIASISKRYALTSEEIEAIFFNK